MALFKILKGDSSRIDTNTTPFNEGFAYFTPDDGGFYIDALVGGTQKRIRINKPSTPISATLLASGWSSGQQTISVTGVTASSNGIIGLSQSATSAQLEAARDAELQITGQGNGTVTITANNGAPSVDIPVVVILIA